MRNVIVLIVLLCSGVFAMGEIKLPSIFSDHMVLQRNKPIPVWGQGMVGETVVVALHTHTVSCTVNKDGRWKAILPALPAGGPYELKVSSEDQTCVVQDVLLGEVWLASGQSNMEWTMRSLDTAEGAADVAQADFPQIRQFKVSRAMSLTEQEDVSGSWAVCTPETVKTFSAIAYYFAEELHRTQKVPVGILHSSFGGTDIEAWMPATRLKEIPFMAERLEKALQPQEDSLNMREDMARLKDELKQVMWHAKDPGNRTFFLGWAEKTFDDSGWDDMTVPGEWEKQGLYVDGSVWFRKHVVIPAAWDGLNLVLDLGQVDDYDTTYMNGVLVGKTGDDVLDAYNTFRSYSVPADAVDAGTQNVITVRVFDSFRRGGFTGQASLMRLYPEGEPDKGIALSGIWKYKVGLRIPDLYADPASRQGLIVGDRNTPTTLYNGMIHGMVPYALRGIIWYQGENNASRASEYATLFPHMILAWRSCWKDPDLPFYFVQLANYKAPQSVPCEESSDWADLRYAQSLALQLPHTGMAITTDVGDATNIHPKKKKPVGRRLARMVRADVYGESLHARSPAYKIHTTNHNQVIVEFSHAAQGLSTLDGKAPRGFAVRTADEGWKWAPAKIEANRVVLDAGPDVVEISYNWANNPVGNVGNSEGLPLAPFRTQPPEWNPLPLKNKSEK